MKYSTAKWLSILLTGIGAVTITTYFTLDANDLVHPLFGLLVKPIMIITLFPGCVLMYGMLVSSRGNKKEKGKIPFSIFIRAFLILLAILVYRLINGG